jgi:protein tyrosine phosphatase (PTP) superfamily phosphohydrolase (DUF442 family)
MGSRIRIALGAFLAVALCAAGALAQQVTKETVPGITNLARLETTIACAGAITADAVPAIRKMGFVSIINLRLATEAGAEVEKEELAAITTKGAEPAFVHCAGGNRAATMWLIRPYTVSPGRITPSFGTMMNPFRMK